MTFTLFISALTLTLSIIVDINWLSFRAFLPAKSLGFLRLLQAISLFTLAYLATFLLLEVYVQSHVFRTIVAGVFAVSSSVIVGVAAVRRGAKIRLEDVVKEKDLITEIKENVSEVANNIAHNISIRILESLRDTRASIQSIIDLALQKIHKAGENFSVQQKEINGMLQGIFTALSQINKMLSCYNDVIKLYDEEVQKLELLNAQLEEVTLLKEEYTRRLEGLERSPQEEFEEVRVKLTEADGRASRRLGNEAQHETANILRSMGFEVEEYYGVGQPDYILIWNGKRVAVGAHKAYSLSEKNRQRTINSKDIGAEIRTASKLKLPLLIIVTNLKNNRRWAEIIHAEKVKEFEKFTTPLILVDDKPETRSICEETFLKLKEVLMR